MKRSKSILLGIVVIGISITTNFSSGGFVVNASTTPDIAINIDPTAERSAISPYIYGLNQCSSNSTLYNNTTVNSRRQGGNRFTAYNWENNYSNAGSDWKYESDDYLSMDLPADKKNQPASVVTSFHDKNLADKVPYSLVTLQAAGMVSADGSGPIAKSDFGSPAKFKKVQFSKNSPFSLTPDLTDDTVYMDEFVNYLVNKYGKASTATGIKGYSIDNEPDLWSSTHAEIYSAPVTCKDLLDKNIALSKSVKKVDPSAEIFGLASYGFAGYLSLQSASDWDSIKSSGNYSWFLDYYLDTMKKASDAQGQRLLDVLDLHWYPEAMGGGKRITDNDVTNIDENKARIQAPRTLWDSTYKEDSWIGQWGSQYLPLIPNVQKSIDKYNPDTKLSFSEYNYGGESHISGGIAEADVLGIFGKYGVYFSTMWPMSTDSSYIQSGINLYTNYDGKGDKYGDMKVKAETSDNENSSVYSSITKSDDGKLHIILLNKNYDNSETFDFNIAGETNYVSGKVYGFDGTSAAITEKSGINNIIGNKFNYTVPPLTALHIVLDCENVKYGDLNSDGIIDIKDYAILRDMILKRKTVKDNPAGDVSKDGKINVFDYLILKNYLAGKINSLPVNK
ncbi:MAG: glycoside hydrolase family 44 protein [Bacillota bacterium]|nr:glycoside hydrolase family 44 protein [Bacillota bacterium]